MKLRTPADRFENLEDYPFKENYLELENLRMHYVSEGLKASKEVVVCLHGEPSWSYLYRHMIPPLAERFRVLAPDLIGFGKSDKLPSTSDYSFHFHYNTIVAFFKRLKLKNVTLVMQDWGGVLGLVYAANHPEIIKRMVIMNTGLPGHGLNQGSRLKTGLALTAFLGWRTFSKLFDKRMPVSKVIAAGTYPPFRLSKEVERAYNAPFPSAEYKAVAASFPSLVPLTSKSPGAADVSRARDLLSRFRGATLVMFSDRDPITSTQADFLYDLIPGTAGFDKVTIKDAGHFLQEDKPGELVDNIIRFIQNSSPGN